MIKSNKNSDNDAHCFYAKFNQIPRVNYFTANHRHEKIGNYNLIAV
jgi:hypothetical protein